MHTPWGGRERPASESPGTPLNSGPFGGPQGSLARASRAWWVRPPWWGTGGGGRGLSEAVTFPKDPPWTETGLRCCVVTEVCDSSCPKWPSDPGRPAGSL